MQERRFRIGVVGATGAVGQIMLALLHARAFPASTVVALASQRSVGACVDFGGETLVVQDTAYFDFTALDLVLFSAGSAVSQRYVQRALDAGCYVIDNTSCFRYDVDVPLIIPEVNGDILAHHAGRLIANPNCIVMQLLVALKPIYDCAGIVRMNVSTYQSVSGAGSSGIAMLQKQVGELASSTPLTLEKFPKQIAFNLIPQIDTFHSNGYTREEMKIVLETQKIFDDPHILVNPTAVRVPVYYGHAASVHLETRVPFTAEAAEAVLAHAPGVVLYSGHDYPTPCDAAGKDGVFVGRVRADISHAHGLNLWIVSDNLRKGAALNSIQIAELLVQKGYL